VVEQYSVSYLPAASFLAVLPAGRRATGAAALLAHSWEDRLPLATAEVDAIAQTLADGAVLESTILTEAQTTAAALRELAAAGATIVSARFRHRSLTHYLEQLQALTELRAQLEG